MVSLHPSAAAPAQEAPLIPPARIDSQTLFAGGVNGSRKPLLTRPESLADENPTFGVTNGRFAAGRPVLMLAEPDKAKSMAATLFTTTEDPPSEKQG